MTAVDAALTIRASKRIIHELVDPGAAFDPQACAALVQPCFESEESMKCRRAFIGKSKPVFQGKWSPPPRTAREGGNHEKGLLGGNRKVDQSASPQGSVSADAARRRKFPLGMSPNVLRWSASLFVAAALWELCARVVDNTLFLAPLTAVVLRFGELWALGELQTHIWVSFIEFAGGFALSALVGILFGVVMAASISVRGLFDPWVSMLYATPVIALGPLFILWFGIGVPSKIAIVFLTAVFPILINTVTGLTTTDRNLLDVARSLGATPAQIYRKVRLPAALPYIIAGLRLGVARALVGVVVAELFGARAGLGFLILSSAQSFDTAGLFVGVLILAVAGVVSVEALKWLETRLAPWRFQDEEP